MFNLFFGNLSAALTTVAVLIMLALIAVSFIKQKGIDKWGRRILIIVLVGTAISGLSATRDAFMTENAMFAVNSFQSIVCSVAGGLIFLTGIVAIFVKNQTYRKFSFQLISALLIIQVITIEASRIALI